MIDGWFVQPRPFVVGPLAVRELSARAADLGAQLGDVPVAGMLALAFDVDRGGRVRACACSPIPRACRVPRSPRAAARPPARPRRGWLDVSPRRAPSRVALPLAFERG